MSGVGKCENQGCRRDQQRSSDGSIRGGRPFYSKITWICSVCERAYNAGAASGDLDAIRHASTEQLRAEIRRREQMLGVRFRRGVHGRFRPSLCRVERRRSRSS